MEMSQGNSLYSYHEQKVILLSFAKMENRRAVKGPVCWIVTSRWEEDVWRKCRMLNMVQTLCTHVCKLKMRPIESIPGMQVVI
jgi:hypothetical protein